ncbi:peroxisomal sarcosine oxidase-like [Clavelina lepadiformis]|uniref:peroxisomal sarcosine oxidase-like n=1 Tax=Clavelina lepadiformis TaxID=159417 RepID=UPI0040427F4B
MYDYDVIVVGAGVIGLSTAYYLSKQGHKTLVLEQFPIPNARGSSYGHSRLGKISHRLWAMSELTPESLAMWRQLQKDSKIPFLVNTGHLSMAEDSVKHKTLDPIMQNLFQRGIECHYYKGNEIMKKFPGIKCDEDFHGFYEPNGIVLKADKCLLALRNEILRYGGEIHDEEKVLKIQRISDSLVTISTYKCTYSAKSTVLACGPWAKKSLALLGTDLPTQAVRVIAYYWKEKKPGMFSASNSFPPFMIYFSHYHLYSTPSIEYPGLIKICYHYRSPVDPDRPAVVQEEDEVCEQKRATFLKSLIQKHFPNLEPVPAMTETYLQTITPNVVPIVDRHPKYKNVVVGAGCSGYGFTIAMSFGKILGHLATTDERPYLQNHFPFQSNLVKPAL